MLPRFAWLERHPPRRISPTERADDPLRLAGFAGLVLLGLSLPGLAVALLMPSWVVLALSGWQR